MICAGETASAARELFANPVVLVSVLGALHAEVALSLPASTEVAIAAARGVAAHQY